MKYFKKKEERSYSPLSFSYNSSTSYKGNKAMLLSALYRCVDVISDSVASLPLEPYMMDKQGYKMKFYNHPCYNILNREPNNKMSRFTFMKTLVVSTLLKGDGYAYIERDNKGDVKALHYIDSGKVTINEETDGTISYSISGIKNRVSDKDMLHIINFTYDGIHGISTLTHARNTLGLASDAENHASGFFKSGANVGGILKVNSTLNDKQKEGLKQSWNNAFGTNASTPNGVAVLEANMDFQPITVNPSDAQLLETRKFNIKDICRFFGVPPTKVFDVSDSADNTREGNQLQFLTDCLAPLLEKIEMEFERKLFKPNEKFKIDVRFDTSAMLRTDKQAEADYINKLFYMGAISVNEIRKKLDLSPIENGDTHLVQSNLMTLDNVITVVPKTDKATTEQIDDNSNN